MNWSCVFLVLKYQLSFMIPKHFQGFWIDFFEFGVDYGILNEFWKNFDIRSSTRWERIVQGFLLEAHSFRNFPGFWMLYFGYFWGLLKCQLGFVIPKYIQYILNGFYEFWVDFEVLNLFWKDFSLSRSVRYQKMNVSRTRLFLRPTADPGRCTSLELTGFIAIFS